MRLETILNQCCKFKSFVFTKVKFSDNRERIIITIKPRKNSRPICSLCETESPDYDKQDARFFEFNVSKTSTELDFIQ